MIRYALKCGADDVLIAESLAELTQLSEMVRSIMSLTYGVNIYSTSDSSDVVICLGSMLINHGLVEYAQLTAAITKSDPMLNYFKSELMKLWGIVMGEHHVGQQQS